MNANEKVSWLNARDPLHEWSVGQDIYCLHCDGVFKAEDVDAYDDGYPTCPVCHTSTPIDFADMPWWRPDLIKQRPTKYLIVNTWRVEPIRSKTGEPTRLPPRKGR